MEEFAGDGVDEAFEIGDAGEADFGEVRSLGVPAADEAVGVFDGALFPGGIGVGVIDADGTLFREEFRQGVGVEEFAAVVGGEGQDFRDFALAD